MCSTVQCIVCTNNRYYLRPATTVIKSNYSSAASETISVNWIVATIYRVKVTSHEHCV
jgi:hypothetical protein